MNNREKTKSVKVRNLEIGGNNHVVIQSMTTTLPRNIDETVEQILDLEKAGCELVRFTLLNEEDALAIKEIKKRTHIPLVADIHFDYRLALLAIENGIDKIRINPGNIGSEENIKKVAIKAKENYVPIRIGINSGSIEKKYKKPTPRALVASAKYHVELLEKYGFDDIIISIKASNVEDTIKANILASKTFKYPLHLGVTESGTAFGGTIKSSIALGYLLLKGIGNTIRVSLTADSTEEIKVAKEILADVGLYKKPTLITCPTCGRTTYDLMSIAKEVEDYLGTINSNITVAIMGCVVNGPGEAKQADLGIAKSKDEYYLFKKGKVIRHFKDENIIDVIKEEIKKLEPKL